MTTLEMMNEAEKTNDTYLSEDMKYSKKLGFYDGDGVPWEADAFKYINDILAIDDWELMPTKRMTLIEIEEELGYKIELVE